MKLAYPLALAVLFLCPGIHLLNYGPAVPPDLPEGPVYIAPPDLPDGPVYPTPPDVDQDLPELPILLTNERFRPLSEWQDNRLQRHLDREFRDISSFQRLIRDKKLCLGIVDLSDWRHPRYASINGHEMLYAASLPKLAVLLAVQDGIEAGEIEETPELVADMHAMIRVSNNAATTRLIDQIGLEKIENTLRAPGNEFYDEEAGGGLWVGKRYAASRNPNRDPLKNLSHAATAYQVCRFYYRLVFGRLVSMSGSRTMLEYMADPGISHKFVHVLEQLAPDASLYRKSGSWESWHADSILVWDVDRRYILVALVEDAAGEQIVQQVVRPVERALNAR